jgi:hypothetical protein
VEEKEHWRKMLHIAEEAIKIYGDIMRHADPTEKPIYRQYLNIAKIDAKEAQLMLRRINDNDFWIRPWEDDARTIQQWDEARTEANEAITVHRRAVHLKNSLYKIDQVDNAEKK